MPDSKQQAAPRPVTVVVIGSPQWDDHSLQFVRAADNTYPLGPDTFWLVEKTGYVLYDGKNRSERRRAPHFREDEYPYKHLAKKHAGHKNFAWLTERHPGNNDLIAWLNEKLPVPDGGIGKLVIYSHGRVGKIMLRYGWADQEGHASYADYGLDGENVGRLSRSKFAPDATVEIHSCNIGTSPWLGPNLAQALANQLQRPVTAWVGRTSYRRHNRPKLPRDERRVGPSRVDLKYEGDFFHDLADLARGVTLFQRRSRDVVNRMQKNVRGDFAEVGDRLRYLHGVPEQKTFHPEDAEPVLFLPKF